MSSQTTWSIKSRLDSHITILSACQAYLARLWATLCSLIARWKLYSVNSTCILLILVTKFPTMDNDCHVCWHSFTIIRLSLTVINILIPIIKHNWRPMRIAISSMSSSSLSPLSTKLVTIIVSLVSFLSISSTPALSSSKKNTPSTFSFRKSKGGFCHLAFYLSRARGIGLNSLYQRCKDKAYSKDFLKWMLTS